MLYNFRNELNGDNSVDVILNQHLLNIKDIEYARKEKQAEFHIKQREMYIENLKAQLAMRDQIIKDKLGASVTNFLKHDLLTLQDIENVSSDVLLPSLKITKSKRFDYYTDTDENKKYPSDDEIYSGMNSNKKKAGRKLATSESGSNPLPSIQNNQYSYDSIINKNSKRAISQHMSKEGLNRAGTSVHAAILEISLQQLLLLCA